MLKQGGRSIGKIRTDRFGNFQSRSQRNLTCR
jgi:hypothetical protein